MARTIEIPVDMRGWLVVEIDGDKRTATQLEVRVETIEHDVLMGEGIDRDDDAGRDVSVALCSETIAALGVDDYQFGEIEWVV